MCVTRSGAGGRGGGGRTVKKTMGWSGWGAELVLEGLIGFRGLLSSAEGEVAMTLEAFVTWR